MAQTKVTSYYCTRRRAYENKNAKLDVTEATANDIKTTTVDDDNHLSNLFLGCARGRGAGKTKAKAIKTSLKSKVNSAATVEENFVEFGIVKNENEIINSSVKVKPVRKGRAVKTANKADGKVLNSRSTSPFFTTGSEEYDKKQTSVTASQGNGPQETAAKSKSRTRKTNPVKVKTHDGISEINSKTRTKRGKAAESKLSSKNLDIRDAFQLHVENVCPINDNNKQQTAVDIAPSEVCELVIENKATKIAAKSRTAVKKRSVKANAKKQTYDIRKVFEAKVNKLSAPSTNCCHAVANCVHEETEENLSNAIKAVVSPVKDVASISSPPKIIPFVHSPSKTISVTPVSSPVKIVTPDSSPVKIVTPDSSPVKIVTPDSSPIKTLAPACSHSKIVTVETNPFHVQDSKLYSNDLQRSPKRNLLDTEQNVFHGKKKCLTFLFGNDTGVQTTGNDTGVQTSTSQKQFTAHDESEQQMDLDNNLCDISNAQSEPHKKFTLSSSEKQNLLHSGKLEEFKKKLAKFEKTSSVLKSFQNSKCKITSPLPLSEQNSTQVVIEPLDAIKKSPAYERFHNLAVPEQPSLTLPYKYKLLSECFRCCDSVISILHNRKEICPFDKLKSSVQNMLKKNFSKRSLGQIKTVFPSAYYYNQEKRPLSFINPKPGVSRYQLVISPNLINYQRDLINTEAQNVVASGSLEHSIKNEKSAYDESVFIHMNPSCLIEREKIFNSNLLSIVKIHHQKFLRNLHSNIAVAPESITRWHPKFLLDSVPDIESSLLPELEDSKKCSTAADVLNKLRGKINQNVNQRVEKALQAVAIDNSSCNESHLNSRNESDSVIKTGVLKGICSELLQKIRAREAAKIVEDITRSHVDSKRNEMLERIPEIVRIIRNYFITARKAAISVEEATQKVVDSYHSSLSPDDVKQHLQLTAELFPNWMYLISIRKGMYLKIDKNKDINVLLDNMPRK